MDKVSVTFVTADGESETVQSTDWDFFNAGGQISFSK
jgi:hypothetical protein